MQWLNNFSLVIRSNITTLCDKFEDPERMLHQLLIDMEQELDRVRNTVAGAIADEIELGNRAKRAEEDTQRWQERAEAALRREDEAAAKTAISQSVSAKQRAEGLADEHAKQRRQTEKLRQAVLDLEEKIRLARQKQTLLLARLARADADRKISGALDRATSESAFAQFSRLERRAERAEAMADAHAQLEGRDPAAEELEREFAAAEREEQVAAELEALKSRLQDGP
jgi:phage shock protein A